MHRFLLLSSTACLLCIAGRSQVTDNRLLFAQGQLFDITMDMNSTISQVVMGQAIDINVGGTANHSYRVTNTTNDNHTLHHQVDRIRFNFEGMGQSRTFDSENEVDLESAVGPALKEVLKKEFDLIIDPMGKVLLVQPEKGKEITMDDRMKLLANMLKDLLAVAEPPRKGENSFFGVLPAMPLNKGTNWTDSISVEEGKFVTNYTIEDINDSTITVNVDGSSSTVTQVEVMAGMQIVTSLNNKSTGRIILDKASGIMKEKTVSTESHGSTQGMGGETPITSRSKLVVKVQARN